MIKITCPNCGAEYLPSELFIPKNFFGGSRYVEKDISGKIVDDVKDMDLVETYRCDYCGLKFIVKATVNFKTECKAKGFGDYSTKIDKPNLFMEEE